MSAISFSTTLFLLMLTQNVKSDSNSKIQGRVAGGESVTAGIIPWQLSIRYDGRHLCSGSIIKSENGVHFALSTISCLLLSNTVNEDGQEYPISPDKWSVLAGILDYLTPSPDTKQERKVKHIWANWQEFHKFTHKWDICLLVLESNFQETGEVAPIALPSDANQPDPAEGLVLVSGWGYIAKGLIQSTLQAAHLPIVDKRICADRYNKKYGIAVISKKSVCAGNQNQSACIGDQGSGAVANSQDGKAYLWGVFQWTLGKCPDAYFPGVFGHVGKFLGWIKDRMDASVP